MNFRRLWAVARKEFIHVVRDARSLAISIALPMVMLFLFGYALSLDVDNVPLVVWDQSQSQVSREFVSRFSGSRYFSLRGYAGDYPELERAIDTRRAMAALVIPTDFAGRVESGRAATAQLIVDGSDSNTATLAIGYAEGVTQAFSQEVALQKVRRAGIAPLRNPLEVQPRVWFNADLESRNYIIPGLIAVIMMIIAAMLTSLTVAREWERGTMEQLISTPVKSQELILGKLLPYFAIGMFDVLLAVLMGRFVFKVPLRGSVTLLFIMAAIFLAGALSMGMLMSITTKSQLVASQMAMVLTFLPAFLLSGFAFAISNMPRPLQWISYLIPARYFITMLKGIFLKGIGLRVLALEAALLTLFGVVMVAIANLKFRKKLE
ncbi:MAG: ABC transporter permease [Acidobacteriia bacterium]|nr:ABC transporter permease [Terriglobia bacterium]